LPDILIGRVLRKRGINSFVRFESPELVLSIYVGYSLIFI